ncbi:MAG: Gfo/Idh/MocA family oxidoreductase [Chloroflexi bacterium]|nr:Gfo/Idh/MocA family oxidoreductase [Chloroflexota bacterium]
MQHIGVGVVGLRRGERLAKAIQTCDGAEVRALCDQDPIRLAAAEPLGVENRYTHFDEMLDREDLDLVVIATATRLHAEMVLAAAARKPAGILCEKPFATNMGEAEAMLAVCDRSEVKLAIGFQGRHYPALVRARDLVADGAIGRPLAVSASVAEGGLLNQGSHLIDRALYVLGDPEPRWVLGQLQRETDRYERGTVCEDLCMGIALVGEGTRIAFDCDIGHAGPVADGAFVIAGEDGMMFIEPCRELGLTAYSLTVASAAGKSLELGPGDLPEVNADVEQIVEMIAWIRGESGNRQDAHVCIKSHAIIMGIYESARTHTLVHMPLLTKESPLASMVADGHLRVRHPGRYDIRHRTAFEPEKLDMASGH